MNAVQLYRCMKSDRYISSQMGGVYSANTLPLKVIDKPKIFIVNLDPNFLPGTHWVVIYCLENEICEYFDSLGDSPTKRLTPFLVKNSTQYAFNHRRIQGFLDSCGMFCLFWAYYRTRGFSFQAILNKFGNNIHFNIFVKQFHLKHFPESIINGDTLL